MNNGVRKLSSSQVAGLIIPVLCYLTVANAPLGTSERFTEAAIVMSLLGACLGGLSMRTASKRYAAAIVLLNALGFMWYLADGLMLSSGVYGN
jgi:hypothetical protein